MDGVDRALILRDSSGGRRGEKEPCGYRVVKRGEGNVTRRRVIITKTLKITILSEPVLIWMCPYIARFEGKHGKIKHLCKVLI